MNLLFVTARFPYPPLKGDKIISYQRLKYFSKKHKITLLSFSDSNDDKNYIEKVSKYCQEIHIIPLKKSESYLNLIIKGLISNEPLQILYYQSKAFHKKLDELLKKNNYDLVHGFMLRISPYILGHTKCPKIIEFIDSMELNMYRQASLEKGFKKWLFREEAKRLALYEKKNASKFDYTIVVSEIDKNAIGGNNLKVAPLGVDTDVFKPKNIDKEDGLIIFTGNMKYFPNERAAIYFSTYIFPLIKEKMPNVKFWIIVKGASRRVRRLENDSIKVLGFVDCMADYINRALVSVVSMESGSGMQFKILEAMACGVPVVATPMAKGDIKLNEDDGLFLADRPDIFADKVVNVMTDKNLQKSISQRAPQAIKDKYSWEASNLIIEDIYRRVY